MAEQRSDSSDHTPPRRPKSSIERGRAFREREREHEATLAQQVATLEKQVAEKTFLRGIWKAKCLRSRHTKHGSLARLVEEYYRVVRYGVRDDTDSMSPPMGRQLSAIATSVNSSRGRDPDPDPVVFLSHVTHPDAVLGDVVGPTGMVDQWKKYTVAHSRYESRIVEIEVSGPEEDPVVVARLRTTVRLTRTTIEMMFPHVLHDFMLTQRLIGREVTYPGSTWLCFSADARILVQDVHFGFVEGLIGAGIPLADVEQLLRGSRVSPTCTLLDTPSVVENDELAHEWEF